MPTPSTPLRLLALPLAVALLLPATLAAEAQMAPVASGAGQREDLAVTIYNDNLGLIKDTRRLSLAKGQLPLRFGDVASQIDATSVSFRSISDANGVEVLEQNYEYDLITPAKLMEKYVGKQVEIRTPAEDGKPSQSLKATLISTNEGYVYRIGNQIHLQPPGQVILPDLPPDLVSQPSLVWLLDVKRPGAQSIEASYMTAGMGWQADYVLVSSANNTQADMTGWVTLKNQSGATYPNARLTLVAGDVHRAQDPNAPMGGAQPMASDVMMERAAKPQFTQQALFEYHAYDLGRRTTLKQNESKQMTLLTASDFATKKVFVFDGTQAPFTQDRRKQKVQVMLEFQNSQKNQLGMPLPKGRVRVYQEDANKKLQFIGEDNIDHPPKDEKVRVEMGNAFDIVGERRQTNQKVVRDDVRDFTYEISLRNHKDEAVTVSVVEHVFGDWKVLAKSHEFTKLSATELEFPVKVPANGETKVSYTVRVVY
jgi:hypothetical protein